jgi:hypothetical protein
LAFGATTAKLPPSKGFSSGHYAAGILARGFRTALPMAGMRPTSPV